MEFFSQATAPYLLGIGYIVIIYVVITECTHFGTPAVRALYTLYAPIYDPYKRPLFWLRNKSITKLLKPALTQMHEHTHLDVATGTARMIRLLAATAEWHGKSTGIDCTPAMLKHAQKRIPHAYKTAAKLRIGDAISLEFPDESFTLVTCIEALEHISSPTRALREMARVTKPNGYILCTKVHDVLVPFIPFRALSREDIEQLLLNEHCQVIGYTRFQFSRYELFIAQKKSHLPAPTRTTST